MTTTPDAAAPVVRAAYVQRPQTETFAIFTDQIGAWWPLPTHGVFGEQAGGLEFRDGRLIELAVDGRESTWGEVRAWEPPSRMVISWHPGRDTGEQSEVEVRFEPDAAGTRVIIEHRGWETFGADARRRRRGYVGPSAWGYVLDHFADVAEPRDQAPDLGGLAAAYDAFFAEAERGGFGPPPADGEWDADQTLAHVALSDLATIAVSQAIIHEGPARFANVDWQTPDHLAAWIVRCGNTTGLIAEGGPWRSRSWPCSRVSPPSSWRRRSRAICCTTARSWWTSRARGARWRSTDKPACTCPPTPDSFANCDP